MSDTDTVTLWAVIFTDDDEMTTGHSAYLTSQEAIRAADELARARWAEDEELSEDPFPEVDDDGDAMDVLRGALSVSLEVEEIEVSASVLRAALAKLEGRQR